jgi:hypothetical protein
MENKIHIITFKTLDSKSLDVFVNDDDITGNVKSKIKAKYGILENSQIFVNQGQVLKNNDEKFLDVYNDKYELLLLFKDANYDYGDINTSMVDEELEGEYSVSVNINRNNNDFINIFRMRPEDFNQRINVVLERDGVAEQRQVHIENAPQLIFNDLPIMNRIFNNIINGQNVGAIPLIGQNNREMVIRDEEDMPPLERNNDEEEDDIPRLERDNEEDDLPDLVEVEEDEEKEDGLNLINADLENINRLVEFGFSRDRCVEAYLVCGRNFEASVNFLLEY